MRDKAIAFYLWMIANKEITTDDTYLLKKYWKEFLAEKRADAKEIKKVFDEHLNKSK